MSTRQFLIALLLVPGAAQADAQVPSSAEFFEAKVRPLLAKHCWSCHGPKKQSGGLRLDIGKAILAGGKRGAAVVPNSVAKSLLIQAVGRQGKLKMPPTKALSQQDVGTLVKWVRGGAFWPTGRKTRATVAGNSLFTPKEKSHWSYQPIADPRPPKVTASWVSSSIDRFILRKQLTAKLQVRAAASRRVWLRRVTFDLTGLPPGSEQTRQFLHDKSPAAYARVVDRLLASPHYGERWGRHWLDVVRYADTTANDGDFVMRYAYRYRNYVVNAHNQDLPYNEFLIEQLAGDLLPASDRDAGWNIRRVVATGLLMLGPKALAEGDKEQVRMDIADEQIDVVSRSMLGLTVACARCHDHKFDPIPTADYYAMAGIFRGVEMLKGNAGITAMWSERLLKRMTKAHEQRLRDTRGRLQHLVTEQQKLGDVDPNSQRFKTAVATLRKRAADSQTTAIPESARANLVVWFDADDLTDKRIQENGTRVRSWRDKSGVGNHLIAPSAAHRPTYLSNIIGKHGVLRFAGNGHQSLRKVQPKRLPRGNASRSMFVVSIPRNKNHNGELLESISQVVIWGSLQSASAANLFQTVQGKLWMAYTGNDFKKGALKYKLGEPALFEQQHIEKDIDGKPRSTFWKNGELDGKFVPRTLATNPTPLIVGSEHVESNTVHHRSYADVAEILVFDRQLTLPERQQVGFYLTNKYQLASKYEPANQLLKIAATKRTKTQTKQLQQYVRRYLQSGDPAYKALGQRIERLKSDLELAQKNSRPIRVMAPIELGARSLRIHVRGNRFDLGQPVHRRFLQIIAGEKQTGLTTKQSGRLELARWIAHRSNPLTARVAVNRIWQGHFGRGLVSTADNFGELGERPSHPELLDWLASRLIESNWSIKAMHRRVVMSGVYRQSCDRGNSNSARRARRVDSENRLLWHFPRRRLSAEEIRDSILAATGQLDRQVGEGGKIIMHLFDNGAVVDKKLGLVSAAEFSFNDSIYQSRRRSLYLPVIRNQVAEVLAVFDVADPSAVTSKRSETTVPAQAMFMMNNAFVRGQSKELAARLMTTTVAGSERVKLAFLRTVGRLPDKDELALALNFIESFAARKNQMAAWQAYCQLLFCLNEFVYLE